jgi:hypothetical protein
MKLLLTGLCLVMITLSATAQRGTISGVINDSVQNKQLSLATITVFNASDTSIITYRLSNEKGEFRIPSLPFNRSLRFIVTYSGYEAYRKTFSLTELQPELQFGKIHLKATSSQLDEVVVMAERPPVTIKNDTIEFNANSFKTLPNALVEDLLKKLPGVQVDKDGNITVNGKPVNRMLVDGKNFFGSDPKMATRNLPANIIDKVQVTDDKEELLRSGDNNLNNVGKVVNITLKKGLKKGIFGKVYAGAGTDGRYEAGGIANIFRDTLQISVLGYGNNLNKAGFGFNDLMQTGGLNRSGSNLNSRSTSIWSSSSGGSSVSVNGVNFGGMQPGGGISESKGAGININHAPNLKQSIFGQYFFGNVHVERRTTTNIQQFNQDTVITNNSDLDGALIINAHNMGIGTRLKPDSVTNIQANVNYTIGLQDENQTSLITSLNSIDGPLSAGTVMQENAMNSYLYRHNLSINRLSKTKSGRRWTLYHGLDATNARNNYTTNATTSFFNPTPYDSVLQQMRYERIPRLDANAGFNYREPLSKSFSLTASTRYEYSKLDNDVNTFNRFGGPGYDKINPSLSSRFERESHRSNSSVGVEYKYKKLLITPSVRALWQKFDNRVASLDQPIVQNLFNFLPAVSVVFRELNLYYDRGVALPSYNYLIPVLNNSNPYYVVNGNPNLLPATRDNLSANYYFNDSKRYLNINLNAYATFAKNEVVQSVIVDDKGIQTTTPVNADGSRNASINYNINKQYKGKSKWIISWNTGGWYGYNRNKLLYNFEESWQATWNLQQWVGFNLNYDDKFEWNNNYDLTYYETRFTTTRFKSLKANQHTLNTEIIVRVPKHVIWEGNLGYDYNGNVPAGLPKDALRLNMAINFTMLKDEKGVLKLSVWDLLNQNNAVSLSTYRNMVTASQTNVLTRYFMATFTYNIRTIGGAKKKVGGGGIFGY